jgi:hypothetical protein
LPPAGVRGLGSGYDEQGEHKNSYKKSHHLFLTIFLDSYKCISQVYLACSNLNYNDVFFNPHGFNLTT